METVLSKTRITTIAPTYQELTVHLDDAYKVAWCYMHATPRPCFSTRMLTELNAWIHHLSDHGSRLNLRYHVLASSVPGIFNLGGDLDLFRALALAGDRDALLAYGTRCIDVLYANTVGFGLPVTTIALVQGEALGGGFEAALSSDVLIAERGARMGFPEILFNLFPGMGAFSLLSRKLDAKRAERMILSGTLYTAEELHAMGLVDILAEDGEGELAVYEHIKRENRARNGFQALRRARDACNPVTYEELMRILEIWVETALKLEKRDLRMMDRLVSRQHLVGNRATDEAGRTDSVAVGTAAARARA
ncbi:crotonase/enoyl-CoA hydratase family protein [Thiocystis violacea]|uniref:crotonase/enoyl-CoA hydratase family protein n=1 Tax=Thiocystis violacea TaxID=13725 RepID=UPI001902FFC5|nr:crotonase/enoyl-CoA hydratase family protein [Thiocystis violacea]MBK1725109.1 enoyl-CoA hydratase [Thiocystis violacea]